MTWIKICGTTNLEDAELATEAGADALGFIFAPSPRRITPEAAARIIRELPKTVVKVGVFQNQPAEFVVQAVGTSGVKLIQLHGQESSVYVEKLFLELQTPVILANPDARVPVQKELQMLGDAGVELGPARAIFALLFDSEFLGNSGGTGTSWDWKEEAKNFREYAQRTRVVVAGGLTPGNVAEALRILHPWGVDVVSGVESKPGKKDPKKLRDFIRAVRDAEHMPKAIP